MRKLGIIAEGLPNSDVLIISELINKIISEEISLCLRPGKDRGNVIKKYRGWLEDFRIKQIDKAIVMVDQDLTCIKELVTKLAEKIEGRNYIFQVKFHIIEREIETWLLSDEEAISKVIGKNIPRVKGDLENIIDPKTKIKELLSKAKRVYTPETLRKIAQESDIERIASRCPGFRRFQQSIIDC